MARKSAGDNDLQKKVRERLVFIKKVVLFVTDFLSKRWREVACEKANYNARSVMVMEGFGGFSFRYSCGESSMGGNHIYISREGVRPGSDGSLLEIYWQSSSDECEVEKFESAGSWVKEIENVIKRKNQIIQQWKTKEEEVESRRREKIKRNAKKEKLEQEAVRLRIR
jgi:hypothetical protein